MVRKKKFPIRWDRLAKDNLDNIYVYIAEDSIAAAKKVKKELVRLAHSLKDFLKNFLKKNTWPISQKTFALYQNGTTK